jgi:hypothetical protein
MAYTQRAVIPLMDRLWAKVDKTDGCWLWRGATSNGYGIINRGRDGMGTMRTHVAVWESIHGPKPESMDIRHSCDVRNCCRPEHLSLGTRAENMSDAVRRGRTRRGESNPHAKVTEDLVRWMRAEHAAGRSARSISLDVGLSDSRVWNIVNGNAWAHIV